VEVIPNPELLGHHDHNESSRNVLGMRIPNFPKGISQAIEGDVIAAGGGSAAFDLEEASNNNMVMRHCFTLILTSQS